LIAAGAVFLIVDGVYVASYRTDDRAGHIALSVLSLLLSIAGPVLVQAALVVPVEALHAGERPVGMAASLRRALGRLRTLVAVVIVYGLGVFFGFLLLVVPGLLAAARWSLMIPAVVIDGLRSDEARKGSRQLVDGQTGKVVGVVVVLWLITQAPVEVAPWVLPSFGASLTFRIAWETLTTPLYAHALTVMYYRLADPDRPVLDARTRSWRSAWVGA
jgi:hypothetical protein